MKPFIRLLLASISLLFAHTQVNACDLDPTAIIDLNSSSEGIFYHGETIILDGQSSAANCGYITEYTWYIDLGPFNQTVSTSVDYFPDSSLNQGQDSRELDIILRVKNSVGNYDYETVTITIVREHSSYYYLTDHLGSVRVTVDTSGTAVGWDDYYPFGLQMPGRTQNANNPDEDIKFTGYELEQQCETDSSGGCINDVTLGLYHAEARMYDPVIGRFNSIDPLASKFPNISPYAYANNNPLRYTDPTGMAPMDWIKDLETDEYVWDNNVKSAGDTPEGFAYVGKTLDDVAADFDASTPGYDFWSKPNVNTDGWPGEIRTTQEGIWDGSENNILYGLINSPWVAIQTLNPGDNQVTHLNGNLTTHNERLQAGAESAPIGFYAGKAIQFARYGREISIGKNFRLAPFGNRTGHPTGRFLHYHRRVFDGNGKVRPGGSMKRHRPWDTRSTDKSKWERF